MRGILLISSLLFSLGVWAAPQSFSKTLLLMGSRFDITVVQENQADADKAFEVAIEEIARIENLISSWKTTSETAQINYNAGIAPVKVSEELFQLISRCQKVAATTSGAFDITFAGMDKLWHFDGTMKELPSAEAIKKSISTVDYQKIQVNKELMTVFLPEKGMKIGFGAIGKGYAANQAKVKLLEWGIENGIVNAGGDLIAWGSDENGEPWKLAVSHPDGREKVLAWLQISGQAVVTSGNYEKFVELDGERYSHIIDPRTGYPSAGLASVTIICPNAELADALATAVFVLGAEEGLALIEQLKGIECMLVKADKELKNSSGVAMLYYGNQKP